MRERSLGKVSVVQMARAARSQLEWVEERVEWAVGMAERILEMGRRWPITPVDMTRVLLESVVDSCWVGGVVPGDDWKHASTVRPMDEASSRPPFPVTALAQPELMMMARIPSPERCSRT